MRIILVCLLLAACSAQEPRDPFWGDLADSMAEMPSVAPQMTEEEWRRECFGWSGYGGMFLPEACRKHFPEW